MIMESNKSKTTKHCAYGTCNSDSRYGDRTEMKNVFFLRFPQPGKDLEKCARWVKACSRVGFDVSRVKKDTYICCKHFVGGKGPTDNHPDPIPANATKYDVEKFIRKPRRIVKRRLPLSPKDQNISSSGPTEDEIQSVPTNDEAVDIAHILLSLNKQPEESNKENTEVVTELEFGPPPKRLCLEMLPVTTCLETLPVPATVNCSEKLQDVVPEKEYSEVGCQAASVTSQEVSLRIQNKILETENKVLISKLELKEFDTPSRKELTTPENSRKTHNDSVRPRFDISDMKSDEKMCKFYTGLTFIQLMQLWKFLEPAVKYLKYWNRSSEMKQNYLVSAQNALLMTLMRLRNGYTNQDLAYQFGVSVSTVSNTILTWIQFLYQQFLPLKNVMFANRSRIRETMPACFKKYKNIRCIIDCTEFFCQRPSNFARQGNLYSSYKSHCTFKVLVAVAPNGAVMFTSDVFEGSISDREIVIKCGFLDYLCPGDTVMADRGFNIRDLLNERKVDLIIPPFLGGRKCLAPQEEALTKDIAKHRIHVERSIERIKKYRLLHKVIPLSLQPVITQIVFIVGCLVNFQEPLVK